MDRNAATDIVELSQEELDQVSGAATGFMQLISAQQMKAQQMDEEAEDLAKKIVSVVRKCFC